MNNNWIQDAIKQYENEVKDVPRFMLDAYTAQPASNIVKAESKSSNK